MWDEKPADEDDPEGIERTIECAEELSRMVQDLNAALSRGDFEEFRENLSKVKLRIFELEKYLNIID